MKLILGRGLNILDANPMEIKKLKEVFSIFNPAYAKAKKKGMSTWNIPKVFFYIYLKQNRFILPCGSLHFLQKHFSNLEIEDRRVFNKIELPLVTKIVPREWQKNAVLETKNIDNGIFKIPTAGGKTIFGIMLAAFYRTNTLIICDSKQIFKQWCDSVKKFFGFDAGMIAGPKFKIEKITIAMSQTLSNRREEIEEYANFFGLLIVDECQMIGPVKNSGVKKDDSAFEVYNNIGRVVSWFSAKKKFGLSDSAMRSDGQTDCVYMALGPVVYELEFEELEEDGLVVRPELVVRPTEFKASDVIDDVSAEYTKTVFEIVKDEERMNLIIADLINEKEHFNLILANNRFYVRTLAGALIEKSPDLAGKICVLTSSTPDKKRVEYIEKARNREINFLFCTSLADKGMDVPSLDRLFLVYPGKFEGINKQRLGRVVRSAASKNSAKVYDYVDIKEPIFRKQFIQRVKDVYMERTTLDQNDDTLKRLKLFQ